MTGGGSLIDSPLLMSMQATISPETPVEGVHKALVQPRLVTYNTTDAPLWPVPII